MTYEDVKKDVECAHAIFDLCGIEKLTRAGGQTHLRARALLVAARLGVVITDEQLLEQLNLRKAK